MTPAMKVMGSPIIGSHESSRAKFPYRLKSFLAFVRCAVEVYFLSTK